IFNIRLRLTGHGSLRRISAITGSVEKGYPSIRELQLPYPATQVVDSARVWRVAAVSDVLTQRQELVAVIDLVIAWQPLARPSLRPNPSRHLLQRLGCWRRTIRSDRALHPTKLPLRDHNPLHFTQL